MTLKPFPLLDFQRGLYGAKEPWISPKEAWQELINFKLYRGRLEKRKGYRQFAELGTAVSGESVGNGLESDYGTLANSPLRPPALISDEDDTSCYLVQNGGANTAKGWADPFYPTQAIVFETLTVVVAAGATRYTGTLQGANNPRTPITFSETGGTTQEIVIDFAPGAQYGPDALVQGVTDSSDADPAGTNTWTPASSYPTSGSYDVTFATTTVGTVEITYDRCIGYVAYGGGYIFGYDPAWPAAGVELDYEWLPGLPVMGIHAWKDLTAGDEYLVAGDTETIWQWDADTSNFADAIGALTGTDSDFLHFCPFEDICVINNGKDKPQKYTASAAPPTIGDMGTGFTGGADQIQAAMFCFRSRSRLIYVGVKEGGVWYLNRMRWTPVNDVEYGSATGDEAQYYSDAATNDRLVGAKMIGDDIVVRFEESVWRIRYVSANPYEAYRWERLPSVEGSGSKMGDVDLNQKLLYRGRDGLKITDGYGIAAADVEIPDEVLTWNSDAQEYTYGHRATPQKEALLTYAKEGDSTPGQIMVGHLDQNLNITAWSRYDMSAHCFGEYRQGAVQSWNHATAGYTGNTLPGTPNELGGSGLNDPITLFGDMEGGIHHYGITDTDAGENIVAFAKSGKINPFPGERCHLGYIFLIADAVVGETLRLYFFEDYKSSPWTFIDVDLSPGGPSEKVMRVVVVNRSSTFHQIMVYSNSVAALAIDSLILYAEPAGPLLEVPK